VRVVREAVEASLLRAREAYLELASRGEASERTGRGAFGDISMKADLVCEDVIMRELERRLGRVAFVSEERGNVGTLEESDYVVLIDPVDGSTNMSRGIGFFSSGIAVSSGVRYSDIFAAGVINLISGDLFIAIEGETSVVGDAGAISRVSSLSDAIFSLDLRALKRGEPYRGHLIALIKSLKNFRFLGSALLEMCLLLTGGLDGFVCLSPELRTMDTVPAAYILEKSGLEVLTSPTDLEGLRIDSRERMSVVTCVNEKLMNEVKGIAGLL